jgi:hypothetical protein
MKITKLTMKFGTLLAGVGIAAAAFSMQPARPADAACTPNDPCYSVFKPDLVTNITSAKKLPGSNVVEVVFTVKNQGSVAAVANFGTTFSYKIPGFPTANLNPVYDSTVAPGESVQHNAFIYMGSAKSVTVTIKADNVGNKIVESNENNNATTITLNY